MRRFPTLGTRIGIAGAVALVAGSAMVIGVQAALTGPALADTSAFELFCTNTPIGNLVFNDVVVSGTLSPASPSAGQQFSLKTFQAQVPVPADIVQSATAVGNTSLSGAATTTIAATGATPSSMSTGAMAYAEAIPNPVPSSGITLGVPTTPATIGPFTATSNDISLSLGSSISLTFTDVAIPVGLAPFQCSAYPNGALPSGVAQAIPPGLPISPVIAAAGSSTTTTTSPLNAVTGPYELYCPHTPVGDLDFNDVTTSATVSPAALSAGDQFQVTGYQTDIPLPPGVVSAAAGLGNSRFDGLAASDVDAYGTTISQLPTGSMGFDVPIPDPVPSSDLALTIPSAPSTVGPFTAVGGPITIAQDQSILVVAKLSSKAFTMSCLAYPNNSIATSGSTGTPPSATPIRPIIAIADASGTPIPTTTTTTLPPGTGNQTPGAPYELYCPGTPIGDLAVNDVATTGSISPATLNEGDQFQVTGVQTQFSIPQGVAQQAENLGLTTLSGDLSLFLYVTGSQFGGYGGTGVGSGSGSSSGTSPPTTLPATTPTTVVYPPPPYPGPYPFPGTVDLSFDVTLPSPVPSTGVQFTASTAPGSPLETFIAAGGPIQVFVAGANLDVSAFGDQFGLFCTTLANDTVPTGLSAQEPDAGFVEPLVTMGSATTIPPPPGAPGAYELYCPGTPVGSIALNDVSTTGSITPANPGAGDQFSLTGYQTSLSIPASIAAAAAALGNSSINGSASGSVDAVGATPAQIATGTMAFDVPLPSPIPAGGVTLTVPSAPETVGPFTASGGAITLTQDASIQLVLVISGSDLMLHCSAYPDNDVPTGIVTSIPGGTPTSPVIATTASTGPPTTVPTTTSPGSGSGSTTPPVSPVAVATGGSTESVTGATTGSGGSSESTGSGSASGPSSAQDSTDASTVQSSPSSLAHTGPGLGTELVAMIGLALVVLGLSMLGLAEVPRRLGRRLASVSRRQ